MYASYIIKRMKAYIKTKKRVKLESKDKATEIANFFLPTIQRLYFNHETTLVN